MKKASPFIHGTLVLTAANFFSRCIGFYNRIFLAGLIGAHQTGVYQLIFPIYLVGFSFCFQGFQTALSKITAAKKAKGQEADARKILRITTSFTLVLSVFFAAVIFVFSEHICLTFLKEADCIPCLKTAVLALPFVGMKACIHSYSLGLGKPELPAISLCIEQVSRVMSIFLISITFFAQLPAASVIAVLGMVIGEIVSFLFTMVFYLIHHKGQKNQNALDSSYSLLKDLLSLGIPLTCNALSVTLLQSVESILIPMMLTRYYGSQHRSIEIYGILTGMALPFIQFPSTITNSLSVMLLPKVSAAKAEGNAKSLHRSTSYSLFFCILLGFIGFLGFFSFGPWIGQLVFHNSTCGDFLRSLSFLCPFLYLSGTLSSILNGLGETKTTLLHNSISLTIQILFILFVIPSIGIHGYLYGLFVSVITLVFLNSRHLKRQLRP